MPTKTPREIENKLEEIKYNFLNYNGVHTKEYMYDFLVTKPMLALLEEARQEAREEIRKKFIKFVKEETSFPKMRLLDREDLLKFLSL